MPSICASEQGIHDRTARTATARLQGLSVGAWWYRLDLLVEGAVIVEVKAVEKLEPVHSAQLLSYRFASCRVGLLFNFNVKSLIEDGLKRVVNAFPE